MSQKNQLKDELVIIFDLGLTFMDQPRFFGNCPPTPPLTQHFALSESER